MPRDERMTESRMGMVIAWKLRMSPSSNKAMSWSLRVLRKRQATRMNSISDVKFFSKFPPRKGKG